MAIDRTDPSDDGAAPPTPKHTQFRQHIAAQITSGNLTGGQFLPSEPSLAKQFLISRGTVRQALAELQSDGLVERIPGKGTLVVWGLDEQRAAGPLNQGLNVYAIVLPELSTGHYPALVQGFDEAASRVNHQTIFCATANDLRRQGDIVLQLIDKKVAGVALTPPTIGDPPAHHIRQLHNNNIPLVLLHRGIEGVSVPVVALPYERIAVLAAETLLANGHRRIAYFASHRGGATERYEKSFRDTIVAAGGELLPELVHYGQIKPTSTGQPTPKRMAEVETALANMLQLPHHCRPTAAFDPWDADAESVFLAALALGKRVPDDFSLVSFGGTGRLGTLNSRITRVTIDERDFAEQVIRLLQLMRTGKEPFTSDRIYEVDIELFPGNTLAPHYPQPS
jgi:DNA-binding LacI/PurR family transcriptional regulator